MPSLHASEKKSEDMRMRRTSSQIMRDQAVAGDGNYQQLDGADDKNRKACCGGRLSVLACIGLIVATIGLILLLIYLVSPVIARPLTNDGEVSFNSVQLSNVDVDSNTADLTAEAVFTNHHATSAKIHPTTADLTIGGKRFGTFDLPTVNFDGDSENIVEIDGNLRINANNFNTFIGQIFSEENVAIHVEGSWPMTIGALHTPYGVKADIPSSLTGFNNFDGDIGTDIDIDASGGSTEFVVFLDVNSASEVELTDLGVISFDLVFNDNVVATVSSGDDFSILMGQNTIELRGPLMAPPANGAQTAPPVPEEEVGEEEAVPEEEVGEEFVNAASLRKLLQTSDDLSPTDELFSNIFAGNPLAFTASGSIVPGADAPINLQFTSTPGQDTEFDGPLIRSLAFADIFAQSPDVTAQIATGAPTDVMVAVNFFNPFNETMIITNVDFDLDIGELNTRDPFGPILRLNNFGGVPNPNVDVVGTLPFGSIHFAGDFSLFPSSVNHGDNVLMTTLTVNSDALLNQNAQEPQILAQRLQDAGRDGNILGIAISGTFSFDIGDISGTPVVESTMMAFGCDISEDQMEDVRVTDDKGQIELFCDQILADDDDLLCPPDVLPTFCNIPQENVNNDFFLDREIGICREERHICDIHGGCNHVIDLNICKIPDDVLAGPEACWRQAGFIVPTSSGDPLTIDFDTWLNVTCCIQTVCM